MNRLRYHFFFFRDFSIEHKSVLSDSTDNFDALPIFGDSNFLYHFGFLYNNVVGLDSGLCNDIALRERSFSLSSGELSTASVHSDDDIVLARNFGDGGQNRFKPVGVAGLLSLYLRLPESFNCNAGGIFSLRFAARVTLFSIGFECAIACCGWG